THNAYISMGETAENVADRFNVTREAMDEYAKRSQDLAVEARDAGFFDREIVAVETPDNGSVDKDDGPRPGTTVEKLAELKPVFREEGGRVTAGNSCPLHGGAIALGHPFGMTGARIMTTLLNDLESDDKQIGLETMCVAGGQGMAMVVERLN